jgi:hypothetical protein
MQIRFTNYKKTYIILGIIVFVTGSLYLASEILVRRQTKSKAPSSSQNQIGYTNNQPTQNIAATNVVTKEQEQSLTEFLSSKTKLIADSFSGTSVDFRQDSVFSGVSQDLLNKIVLEMQKYQPPIKADFRKIIINSDGRSGRVYTTFTDASGTRTNFFEIVYSQNVNNQWKLVDFIANNSLQTSDEFSNNP